MIAAQQPVALRNMCSMTLAQNATDIDAASVKYRTLTSTKPPYSMAGGVWHNDCCNWSSVDRVGHTVDRHGGAAQSGQNAVNRSHNEWEIT
jgi:hypothetical protein